MGALRREIETTYAIVDPAPEQVAHRIYAIENLQQIGLQGYRIAQAGHHDLSDVYFDLPRRALQDRRLALRLRRDGTSVWVALKGEPEASEWGGTRRLEIEAEWSPEALGEILDALRARGVTCPAAHTPFEPERPQSSLESIGFSVVQERATLRRINHVFRIGEKGDRLVVEWAVDRVTYRFGPVCFLHYEVEIESKDSTAMEAYQNIARAVWSEFSDFLRPWEHSKLATGHALEALVVIGELADSGEFEDVEAGPRNLTAADYDRIHRHLARDRW
ncbi:MAG: CYTH domain-containing protein [SAR324 cluster bacterium]|nr:CYTH domain-containing protein [SAR324 cluster bacterium]